MSGNERPTAGGSYTRTVTDINVKKRSTTPLAGLRVRMEGEGEEGKGKEGRKEIREGIKEGKGKAGMGEGAGLAPASAARCGNATRLSATTDLLRFLWCVYPWPG